MPRTIRKHPFAFVHALGWVLAGLCMLYVMHYGTAGYYAALLADAAVILFRLGCALIVIPPVIRLVMKQLDKRLPTAVQEKHFRQAAAQWYESTRPGFWKYYAAAIAAAALPVLAIFSVVLVGDYVAGVLFISFGASIWLICICIEMPEARLLQVQDTADRFQIRSGASSGEIDRLHAAHTLGIPKKHWEGRRDYLFNMLYKEGLADDRSRIAAYDCPVSRIAAHFGAASQTGNAEEVIWIPLRQFPFGNGKGCQAIEKLFTHHLSRIADLRFESNRSTDPADYPHSGAGLRLEPDETVFLSQSGDSLCLICATAAGDEAGEDMLYLGCMLHISGPRLVAVKWDQLDDVTPPNADNSEYFLNPANAGRLFRLLLKNAFPYEIVDTVYLEDEQLLALEIWAEQPDGSCPVDDRGVPFVVDDGSSYLLLIAYDSLRWHWMQATDLARPQAF